MSTSVQVSYKGYSPQLDEKIDQVLGEESVGGGYFFPTNTRDLDYEVEDFAAETHGAALTELGVQWQVGEEGD